MKEQYRMHGLASSLVDNYFLHNIENFKNLITTRCDEGVVRI